MIQTARALAALFVLTAAPAAAQESFSTTAAQALHRGGVATDPALLSRRDRGFPGTCSLATGAPRAQVERHAIDAGKARLGLLPAFLVPCALSVRNRLAVVYVDGAGGFRPLVAEVPVIAFDAGSDGAPDWRGARIEGWTRTAILADPELDAALLYFAVPQPLDSGTLVTVTAHLSEMALVSVIVAPREGEGRLTLLGPGG